MVLCRKVFQYFCVGFTVISVISISIIIYYQNLPRNHFLHDIEVVHGHLECEDPYDVVGNFMRYRLQIYPLRNLSTIDLQGNRTLTCCQANDLREEADIPAGHATFHGDAFFVGVLL